MVEQVQVDKIIGIVKDIFSILGIVLGGLWAYYNYFKGRIYRDKLELHVDGQVINPDKNFNYLLITYKLKNVGLSNVIIKQEGSALIVYSYNLLRQKDNLKIIDWEPVTALSVFKKHQWIEPGESIEEQQMINVPIKKMTAFNVTLRIISGKSLEWNADKIILPESFLSNVPGGTTNLERREL